MVDGGVVYVGTTMKKLFRDYVKIAMYVVGNLGDKFPAFALATCLVSIAYPYVGLSPRNLLGLDLSPGNLLGLAVSH